MKTKRIISPEKYNPATNAGSAATTRNWKIIRASQKLLYRAFTDPKALPLWLAPGKMTGKVHSFKGKVGGGYRMSLFYPPSEEKARGKTSEREDRFTARFLELVPPRKIVQAITFDSGDPAFAGEMLMEVTFVPKAMGTKVTIIFRNIPRGIRPEDNRTGTRLTLEKLARYMEING